MKTHHHYSHLLHHHHQIIINGGAPLPTIKIVGETRWGSVRVMLECVDVNYGLLVGHVTGNGWLIDGTPAIKAKKNWIKDVITNPTFRTTLQKALQIVTPIDVALKKSEKDNYFISDIYHDWKTE